MLIFVLSVAPKGIRVVLLSRTRRVDCLWHLSSDTVNLHSLDTKKVTV